MTAAAVSIVNARRAFDGAAAVDGVSLTAPAGQVLALLGPSGSGKSTLLRLIAGLEPLDDGEIRIAGELVSARNHLIAPERRRVGVVFQDYALFPHLNAAENVAFGLTHLPKDDRRSAALAWLDRVALERRAHAYPHEMSGGEQQRVALARALAPQPRAVLLDEPFSGLDAQLRANLRDLTLSAIREADATAIFVTHDADEALYVADRLAVLNAGRVLQEDAPRAVYDRPASPEAAAALGPVNVAQADVVGGVAQTPFGGVPAPSLSGPVRVAVRAEAVTLVPGDAARVIDRRPQGPHDLVRLEAGGMVWSARAPRHSAIIVGEKVGIAIDPTGAFAFPA
ncbi:MAG: ATP-binding cassette domain-containing protein [Alphaproteobacteria bacterium]|nr:ATP-binding cassette domain-containing protein [Alphaproteobacteria bacterium]